MRMLYSHSKGLLIAEGVIETDANCIVRNELNGWRKLHVPDEVVYAMSENRYEKHPYMPRPFPLGAWTVEYPVARDTKYLAPYFIPTTARQLVSIWSLDEKGGYNGATKEVVWDYGYGLHYSMSNTTLGCIKIKDYDALVLLVQYIRREIHKNNVVLLEVTE